ncbi:toxin-antitoxin system YwqK family antitoxin [Sulfurovum sp. NBC37-1]|uniref:toxin-antitoxin system YwqK family antitoxin n=1 Tax=Sulfurovum sp. (strain NBC37-1) TaxID=387093 RepID=UPI0001587DC1|nr:hypothetical protein [Sulfurovum sp. NBC37-1]BAF73395.1 hypothetical protein SUN_2462 [Sulfurovum sp. NBC37-1]
MKVFTSVLFLFSILFFTGCESPYLGGKKVHKEYFTNGQVRSEFIMTDNTKMNGTLKKYGTNGKLTSVVNIRNGVKNGMEVLYDTKGLVLRRTPYVNGEKQGNQTFYYPNQDVLATIPWRSNRKDGIAVMYYPDGSVRQKAKYKNDQRIY